MKRKTESSRTKPVQAYSRVLLPPPTPMPQMRPPTLSDKKATHVVDERQSQLKLLIARGKEQGYLTYAEVNDHLPSEIVDPEQIEDIVNMINDMGIPVYEKAPDAESMLLAEASTPDEEAVEEAAAALVAVDAEFGRTTDPVRMYMREMGTVELLTREGEIRIAKRIEEGLDAVRGALAMYPSTFELMLRQYEPVKTGQNRLIDIIVGFVDPNAPDEIAQPQNARIELARRRSGPGGKLRKRKRTTEEEEALETGPDPEEAARRFAGAGALLQPGPQCAAWQGGEGSEDPEAAQEARRRVDGAEARTKDVRDADRQPARSRCRNPPAGKGNHDDLRAAGRHAAQGFHLHVPQERDQPALAAQAPQGEEEAFLRPRQAERGDREAPEEAAAARRPASPLDQ